MSENQISILCPLLPPILIEYFNRNFDVVVIHKVNPVSAADSSALVIYYLNKEQCVLF